MKKKYVLIGMVLVCVIFIASILGSLYTTQWNLKGYSKYINITIDYDKGLQYIKEDQQNIVYTYHIDDCNTTTFLTAKIVSLSDALFEKLSINDLTSNLQEQNVDNTKIYAAENYKICIIDKNVIIADKNAEISELYHLLRE